MGCGSSQTKGRTKSPPADNLKKGVNNKHRVIVSGKAAGDGLGVTRPQPVTAFRTPRAAGPPGNGRGASQRENTMVETLTRKSVTFSRESDDNVSSNKLTMCGGQKTILKNNPLHLNNTSGTVENIDDYGEQIFEKLEALAGTIVEGYTPRDTKPDRSELIIPEIKYGYLSASTPRDGGDGGDGVPTVEGRTPTALNGVTSSALPLWESSPYQRMEGSSATSHICDVELLSSTRLLTTRNGPEVTGVRLYDVTRDGHQVIGESTLLAPRGVVVDRQEKVIVVTDWSDKTVKFVDLDGKHRGSWKENKFKHPGGIARTREGRFIVSDVTRGSQSLREYSAYGKLIRKFGLSCFDWPWYLTTDSKGRVIVSERATSMIYMFDSGGNLLHKFGGQGRTNGKLNCPSGVAVDAQDNIFVADSDNYRVCMFSPDGRFVKHIATHYLARPTSLSFYEDKVVIATDTSVKLCELKGDKHFLS